MSQAYACVRRGCVVWWFNTVCSRSEVKHKRLMSHCRSRDAR